MFGVMGMLIWWLYNVHMYWNITLYLINLYHYYVSIKIKISKTVYLSVVNKCCVSSFQSFHMSRYKHPHLLYSFPSPLPTLWQHHEAISAQGALGSMIPLSKSFPSLIHAAYSLQWSIAHISPSYWDLSSDWIRTLSAIFVFFAYLSYLLLYHQFLALCHTYMLNKYNCPLYL